VTRLRERLKEAAARGRHSAEYLDVAIRHESEAVRQTVKQYGAARRARSDLGQRGDAWSVDELLVPCFAHVVHLALFVATFLYEVDAVQRLFDKRVFEGVRELNVQQNFALANYARQIVIGPCVNVHRNNPPSKIAVMNDESVFFAPAGEAVPTKYWLSPAALRMASFNFPMSQMF
jgi:hypothetical protein